MQSMAFLRLGHACRYCCQMPVFFALYRVIYNVPAYVSSVKAAFDGIVEGIVSTPGYQGTMEKFLDGLNLTKQIGADFNHTDL